MRAYTNLFRNKLPNRPNGVNCMDFMSSIAAQAMSISNARLAQSYSIALQRKTMDNQEQAMQGILEMLPQQPPLGQHIDVLV